MVFKGVVYRRAMLFCLLLVFAFHAAPREEPARPARFPSAQKLTYRIDWRMITAGTAVLQFSRAGSGNWQITLNLDSSGVVSRLFRVSDRYKVVSNDQFCLGTSLMDAQEGKKHLVTKLKVEPSTHKITYEQDDLIKNLRVRNELDVPGCTHEIAGALAALSGMSLPPGKTAMIPVSDGKKVVNARVASQQQETVSVEGKTVQAIRYEAFLFDNVLYKRKGQMYIWLTDDEQRTPVQIRLQLAFPIGTVSLQLEKQERL